MTLGTLAYNVAVGFLIGLIALALFLFGYVKGQNHIIDRVCTNDPIAQDYVEVCQ